MLIGLLAIMTAGAVSGQAPSAPPEPEYHVERATSAITIDGVLDEQAWKDATVIPVNREWFPGDNVDAPVKTEALITYDNHNFYAAFRAHDPNPKEIRAHLMDRDSINTFVQDDHVTLMLDPFNDKRRGFQFRVNPLGVQADAIFSQVEFVEDFSWDIIWASAGRITSDGYVVEIAIPLNQIRFPAGGGVQTWGVELGRSYPRSVRHRISANVRDRNNNCLLCQVTEVTGFSGIKPGRNLEVDPTVTATRTDALDSFPDGTLQAGDEDYEPGVSLRWGMTPSTTLNATANPDFSQVEADAAQLAENERFALFFPEKRPFFLEGIDFFTTPIQAVFTRTVVDPDWGLKLTGKSGPNAGGVFVTQDTVNSLVIPSNQGSSSTLIHENVTGSVVRYRRDIGRASTIGVLYAGREGDDYHNRVAGFDGFFRLTPRDEIRFQWLRSDTKYPGGVADLFRQEHDSFSGNGLTIDYQHNAREWNWQVVYDDRDEGFRADSGYVPRVDIKRTRGSLSRTWWGAPGARYSNFALQGSYDRTENQNGLLTDESTALTFTFQGAKQSVFQAQVSDRSEFFIDRLYDDMFHWFGYFEIQPNAIGKYSVYVEGGDTVDFSNNQPADLFLVNPAVELKLGLHVNAQLSHFLQQIDVDGGRLSEANLSELRLIYNFSTRMFVRAILQRLNVDRDAALYSFPTAEKTETLFSQLLFSYKLNPQTVLFVGYSDNQLGVDRIDLMRTDRTFFVKLGYAWIF